MPVVLESVLIVDDDRDRIMRVRSAAKLGGTFSAVTVVHSEKQALERLEFSEFQLIFVGCELFDGNLSTFTNAARELVGGQIASFVGLVGANIEQHQIAKLMLGGLDSILSEPFSIDSFHEVLKITTTIVTERNEERRKKLIEIALVDAITYIDAAAGRKKTNRQQKASSRARNKLRATLYDCYAVDETAYFSVLVDKLISLSTKKRKRKLYTGASERLRKKLEKKYVDDLLAEDSDESSG